ncbi:hypothetical protein Droror1_Dr00019599 [Drosera rotundifolia]
MSFKLYNDSSQGFLIPAPNHHFSFPHSAPHHRAPPSYTVTSAFPISSTPHSSPPPSISPRSLAFSPQSPLLPVTASPSRRFSALWVWWCESPWILDSMVIDGRDEKGGGCIQRPGLMRWSSGVWDAIGEGWPWTGGGEWLGDW